MFDPTKPVKTRSGRNARIICTDAKSKDNKYPIIALIEVGENKEEISISYTKEGTFFIRNGEKDSYDLVNIPQEYWINIYAYNDGEYHTGGIFISLIEATDSIEYDLDFVKTIKVEI
jgi:hypothetical protein